MVAPADLAFCEILTPHSGFVNQWTSHPRPESFLAKFDDGWLVNKVSLQEDLSIKEVLVDLEAFHLNPEERGDVRKKPLDRYPKATADVSGKKPKLYDKHHFTFPFRRSN